MVIAHEHAWLAVYAPGPSVIEPAVSVSAAAPLHGPTLGGADTRDTSTVGGDAGTTGADSKVAVVAGLVLSDDEYEAVKPAASTEPSDVNTTYMLPDVVVTAPGTMLPLNDPSRIPALLVPSYTFTKS